MGEEVDVAIPKSLLDHFAHEEQERKEAEERERERLRYMQINVLSEYDLLQKDVQAGLDLTVAKLHVPDTEQRNTVSTVPPPSATPLSISASPAPASTTRTVTPSPVTPHPSCLQPPLIEYVKPDFTVSVLRDSSLDTACTEELCKHGIPLDHLSVYVFTLNQTKFQLLSDPNIHMQQLK